MSDRILQLYKEIEDAARQLAFEDANKYREELRKTWSPVMRKGWVQKTIDEDVGYDSETFPIFMADDKGNIEIKGNIGRRKSKVPKEEWVEGDVVDYWTESRRAEDNVFPIISWMTDKDFQAKIFDYESQRYNYHLNELKSMFSGKL